MADHVDSPYQSTLKQRRIAYILHVVYCLCMPKKPRKVGLSGLIDSISARLPGGHKSLAKELAVSESSVDRWYAGRSRPRPEVEGRLRVLEEQLRSASVPADHPTLFDWPDGSREDRLRRAVAATCRQLRETFHRRGRLSSRQEALDELAKLLFSHVMSQTHGGAGITRALATPTEAAARHLKDFVAEQFHRHTPATLAHEMKPADFELKLNSNENDLAVDVVACFDNLHDREVVQCIRGHESIDVLNDAFGQFITDSFVQEKELGQYLTPNEVVRFMVRLGMSGLGDRHRRGFLHPDSLDSAGLILDPSCGVGTFLTEALRVLYAESRQRLGDETAKRLVASALGRTIVGIDKSERMLRLALTNLAMFGADKVNLHLANALARRGADGEVTRSIEGRAALILTNPPFGATFDGSDLLGYRLFATWSAKRPRAIDSELLFLERYVDWLAPGGHLVAIVPDSILTNRGLYEDLRRGLFPLVDVQAVVSLPSITFGVAGTTTKTSVLYLTRRPKPSPAPSNVFFAVCDSLGYEVQTRGAIRVKVARGTDKLPGIFEAYRLGHDTAATRIGRLTADDLRWDAGYHSGLSVAVQKRLESTAEAALRVKSVARLRNERVNPARFGDGRSFAYIEISDVDGNGYSVRAKQVACTEAPSRARKMVRAGDVLVSTVRPERKTVGVVPAELDGAICSTGFAVLESTGLHPLVLAFLLRHDFVTEQLLKENSGIAYPAVEERSIPDLVLPIEKPILKSLEEVATRFQEARTVLGSREAEFVKGLSQAVSAWL